jgi:hypothetical protein
MSSDPPPRVRVTAPRRTRRNRTTAISEIDAQSAVGEIYVRSLIRSQLRAALGTAVLVVVTIGILPLAFMAVPPLRRAEVAGVPLAWLLLGAGCYPVVLILAAGFLHRAERNERDFQSLVEPLQTGDADE